MIDTQKQLGKGNCGTVYLGFYAKGTGDEKIFLAIKEIPVKASPEVTVSLLQEINVLRKINHQNIVGFIDAKKNEEFMYLVTEYCNQGALDDFILNHNLSEEDVVVFFRQIAAAFKYLVTKKIIHRDIKPQNLLLHNGQVKVADFGLAKVMDQSNQSGKFQTFSGTPVFMSPQIIKQESYNSLSDMWSLGVTFYFMLFREYPWEEVNPLKLLKKIQHKIDNLIPEGCTLSEPTKDLLKRMLVIEENNRISWQDFFNHKAIKIEQDPQFTLSTQDTVEDLTLNNFLIQSASLSLSDKEQDEMQEYGRRQTLNYLAHQNILNRARKAKDHLEFEKSIGYYFLQVAKELESQKKIDSANLIPEDLYIKCMFLLYKRIYCVFSSLNQMLLFDCNEAGIIEIDPQDWLELMTSEYHQNDLQKIRQSTQRDFDISRKEFIKWKEQLYDAQFQLEKFSIIERGDAYKDNSIEENEYLIMAINDNFKEMFLILAQQLEPIYLQILETQKPINKHQIYNEKKIDTIFVYDLIIFLCFRNIVKKPQQDCCIQINFQKYYEDRKRIEEIEILHRIQKQYQAWKQN
ncbi:unnamed protein product [Paramecium sonneborni]|uniref:Protein kinase domain-containing protein n=1 Tax=Paramecium sonneborni TaxID=65129 RepID=A0A8S1RIS9_9CILI|nr:unnamed protein product [Paramecium sonneborni]